MLDNWPLGYDGLFELSMSNFMQCLHVYWIYCAKWYSASKNVQLFYLVNIHLHLKWFRVSMYGQICNLYMPHQVQKSCFLHIYGFGILCYTISYVKEKIIIFSYSTLMIKIQCTYVFAYFNLNLTTLCMDRPIFGLSNT